GEGASFEGTVVVPHGIRIDGQFKGKIEASEMLTVGNSGVAEADIKAKSIIIGGKVSGNIFAAERVELEAKASFIGDLNTRDLVINEGALFHGKCSMKENPEQ
ncbi:MAG: polymer-forming cytoskeletal protein, partial [Chitinispirillaceae bacterium]|nr:polymer-forming cytoskeletal protein [Chitinispirillaceae bacterium]